MVLRGGRFLIIASDASTYFGLDMPVGVRWLEVFGWAACKGRLWDLLREGAGQGSWACSSDSPQQQTE